MPDIIKIKRSDVTATPPSLDTGELAYSEASGNFFIGRIADGVPVKIGGKTDVDKLAGIEDGATGPMSDAEVKTAYENNADTNAFTDAQQSKLSGIEPGAKDDQTDAEIKVQYENNADTNAFTDTEQSKLAGIEDNATDDQTALEIKTAYESNADTNAYDDAAVSKLAGIEDNATADQIAIEVPYANGTSGLGATEVQGAIDEVAALSSVGVNEWNAAVTGSGTIEADTNVMDFTGNPHADATVTTALRINKNDIVSFSHDGDLYKWIGDKDVLVGLGGMTSQASDFLQTGSDDHQALANRNSVDAHPISAITDLQTELNGKATSAQGALADTALQDITGESINDLSDVLSSMTPTDGQVLTYNDANGWQSDSLPVQLSTFVALTDTPADYSGAANYIVKVNATNTGLEYQDGLDAGQF